MYVFLHYPHHKIFMRSCVILIQASAVNVITVGLQCGKIVIHTTRYKHHTNIPIHTIPYSTTLYHTVPYCTIPYHIILYHTVPTVTLPYISIPYHTVPWHTIPYNNVIQYCTYHDAMLLLHANALSCYTPLHVHIVQYLVILVQAPAVDVVAVGLQSGKIVIHNLKYDETVMSFQQDWGPVSCLAFRTGHPVAHVKYVVSIPHLLSCRKAVSCWYASWLWMV